LAASSKSEETALVSLWNLHGDKAPAANARILNVQTSSGARAIEGENVVLVSLPKDSVKPLTPVLRGIVSLPHVVGIAALENELIWLIDTKRFTP
jgi:hypothetical protein